MNISIYNAKQVHHLINSIFRTVSDFEAARVTGGMNAQAEPARDRANEVEPRPNPRPNLVRTSSEPLVAQSKAKQSGIHYLFRIINAYTLHCRIANSAGRNAGSVRKSFLALPPAPEVCGKVSAGLRPRRKYAEKFPHASARAGSERKSFRRLPPAPEVSGKVSAGLRPRRK